MREEPRCSQMFFQGPGGVQVLAKVQEWEETGVQGWYKMCLPWRLQLPWHQVWFPDGRRRCNCWNRVLLLTCKLNNSWEIVYYSDCRSCHLVTPPSSVKTSQPSLASILSTLSASAPRARPAPPSRTGGSRPPGSGASKNCLKVFAFWFICKNLTKLILLVWFRI